MLEECFNLNLCVNYISADILDIIIHGKISLEKSDIIM